MVEAIVDGAEDRQQASPGIVAALQHLLTTVVGILAQCLPQRRDGIIAVVNVVTEQQQTLLLGEEQEDQAHHHRQGRLIDPFLAHLRENRSSGILVGQINRLHQQFDGVAHLIAKLIRDLLAVIGAGGEHSFQGTRVGHAKDAVRPEK